jgi:hypothetical protein
MIHTVWDWSWHSVMDPGNLLASAIVAAPAFIAGHRFWHHTLKPHIERTKQLSAQLARYEAAPQRDDGKP